MSTTRQLTVPFAHPRLLYWLVLVLLTASLLHPAQGASAQPPAKGELPPELKLVPPDSLGFMSVRLAELMTSPAGQRFRKELAQVNPVFAKSMDTEWGIPHSEVERYVVAVTSPNIQELLVIFATTKPYDKRAILARWAPNAVEQTFRGRTYHRGSKKELPCVYLINDRLFVVGSELSVRMLIGNPPRDQAKGPLGEALTLATQKHHLVAGWSIPAEVARRLKLDLPRDLQPLAPLLEAQLGTLTAQIGEETKLDLRLAYANQQQARAGTQAARGAVALGRDLFGRMIQEIEKSEGFSKTLALGKQIEAALKSMSVQQQGNVVHVPFTLKTNLETIMSALIEAIGKVREATQRALGMNNLKQLVLAMHFYHDTHGRFPPAIIRDKQGKPLYSWRIVLLPYLEQVALYREFKHDEPWDSEHNKKLLDRMPRVFAAQPDGPATHLTYYQVLVGMGTAFENERGHKITDITDGTSNTLLIVEAGEAVPWTKPVDIPHDADKKLPKLGGVFQDVFLAALADGSVRVINKKTDEKTIRALITRNGGEVIQEK